MSSAATTMIALARRTQEWLRLHPLVVDVLFACLVATLALSDLSGDQITDTERGSDTVGVLLVLIAAIPLVWRRVAPVAVLIFVIGVSSVFYARDYGSFMAAVGLAALYAVAAHENNRRTAWAALVGGFTVLFGVASFTLLEGVDGYRLPTAISMTLSIAVAVLAGVVVRNKEEIFADTKAKAERAEAERKAVAERAVTSERLRIAREMHDVVAHGMSLITVQAAAAREIAHASPDDAARLMHSVETTGRDALSEMRRMLGVLRSNDPLSSPVQRGDLAPQPSIADLDTIVSHCVEAGIPTKLVTSGDVRPLPPGIELAVFRIVQEALTNVVKHGGSAATANVELRYKADTLVIKIRDTGRGAVSELTNAGGGHGLIGMRERIEIYDGQLDAGPRPGGGYKVEVSLPISTASDRPVVTSAESEDTRVEQ